MRFLMKPHQGKERPYLQALLDAGHVQAKDADVVLIDFEIPYPQLEIYAQFAAYAKQTGAALVSYPHGLALVGGHQLTQKPYECAASFVNGPGQKRLREIYQYPNPVYWVGYPGPRIPLEPRECRHVLFAPIHPLGSGWLPDYVKQANREAFRTLIDGPYELTVRLIGSLEQNGIWDEVGVRYVYGQMDGSVTPGVDVAVATGTYAANCLCQGIPVVMFFQEDYWHIELEGQESTWVPEWREHESYVRYPYDLFDSASEPCRQAATNPYLVQPWMARFMPPFDAKKFADLVEAVATKAVSPS